MGVNFVKICLSLFKKSTTNYLPCSIFSQMIKKLWLFLFFFFWSPLKLYEKGQELKIRLNTLGLDFKSVLYLRREVAHAFVVSHSVSKIKMIATCVQQFWQVAMYCWQQVFFLRLDLLLYVIRLKAAFDRKLVKKCFHDVSSHVLSRGSQISKLKSTYLILYSYLSSVMLKLIHT